MSTIPAARGAKRPPNVCPICAEPAREERDPYRAIYTYCDSPAGCQVIYVTHWGRRTPSIVMPLWEDRRWVEWADAQRGARSE
jgi:hypothetical protein